MISRNQDFYEFSPRGRADEGDDRTRSIIKDNIPATLDLAAGTVIHNLRLKLEARHIRGEIEDVPWCTCFSPIVSNRMRELIDATAPKQVQFLPVSLVTKGNKSNLQYWLINTLLVLDCHHPELSDASPAFDIVIEKKKVPPDALIFRDTVYTTSLFVRSAFKDRCHDAGITGAQFYSVEQI